MAKSKSQNMASTSRKYPPVDMKLLYGNAAGLCAYPNCPASCLVESTEKDDAKNIGEISHIVAHNDGGPRSDPDFPMDKRDCYANWILLCPTHHKLVDVQPNTFTVADLKQWKTAHEQRVRELTRREISNVTFAELEIVCKAVLSQPLESDTSLALTPPLEKMQKNELTAETHFSLVTGLGIARKVEMFVNQMARIYYNFPDRLSAGFVEKYNELREQGVKGDALFEALQQFACNGQRDFKFQAAGLSVLAYLFEKCEVFEK